jgi:hypothetical protein
MFMFRRLTAISPIARGTSKIARHFISLAGKLGNIPIGN